MRLLFWHDCTGDHKVFGGKLRSRAVPGGLTLPLPLPHSHSHSHCHSPLSHSLLTLTLSLTHSLSLSLSRSLSRAISSPRCWASTVRPRNASSPWRTCATPWTTSPPWSSSCLVRFFVGSLFFLVSQSFVFMGFCRTNGEKEG